MHKLLNLSIFAVVFITFINALFFFGLGVYHSVLAYIGIFTGELAHPGIVLVEAMDRFLIGFVFIIFSVGLAKLFLTKFKFLDKYELPWLELKDFHQLKTLLIAAILIALFVAWIPEAAIFDNEGNLSWTSLVFPISLLIMSVAARLIKDLH